GIIAFRRTFDGVDDAQTLERLNAELVRPFELTGRGLVSSTRLRGTHAIRMCLMNHTSGQLHVTGTLRWLATSAGPAVPVQRGLELGSGDLFGELAALDWGAGFGYARTADVVATSSARLLVLAPATLAELIRRAPQVEVTLRRTARDRARQL